MRKTKPAIAKKSAIAKKKPAAAPRKKKSAARTPRTPRTPSQETPQQETPRETLQAEPIVIDVELDADADLLVGLIEKTKEEPGAPFAPEVLAALADLKRKDRKAFESLRAGLKRAGCRVASLDESLSEEISGGPGARSQSQVDIILQLAQAADLFHGADATAYADIVINGHRETWPVKSKGFQRWLARAFYEETRSAAGSEALQSSLNVIESRAQYDSPEREAYVRVARLDDKVYIDLCDSAWCAIEIDSDGWRIVDVPPARFRRASGALELPAPIHGGSIDDLKPFLNISKDNDRDFVLLVAWILAALIETGPYPALAFTGEQGVAKSTASKVLRALVDPNTAPLRALPRSDRELFISATNAHLLVFDNVSGLQPWLSDTLCRLSSGGGFAVRSLYSNNDDLERLAADHSQWNRRHHHGARSRGPRPVHRLGGDFRR